ncbi:MAG: Fic family protein, partial [Bdellovibrionota bacterium]
MWIYEQKDWPHFIWDDQQILVLLADVRHRQGLLLGGMQALGFDFQQEASLNTLISDVVKTSAIEGERLDREAVRSSIARRIGIEGVNQDPSSRDVEGVVEMMLDATQNFEHDLTDQRLFGWHAALFPTGRSGMRTIEVGKWRSDSSGPMQVVSGSLGKERIHFQAPVAKSIKGEMQTFLKWFHHKSSIDMVLRAAIAHFWFVTIHPFEDGNGRIARAISDMALAQAEETSKRFYSLSTQIEAEKKDYYDLLEKHQKGNLDITGWLIWFLSCFGRAIDRAETIVGNVFQKAKLWDKINQENINERQRAIINRMLEDDFMG